MYNGIMSDGGYHTAGDIPPETGYDALRRSQAAARQRREDKAQRAIAKSAKARSLKNGAPGRRVQ